MEVLVRFDDSHGYHAWNWIRDRFLSMDKGTTRELLGAHVFKIEIRGRRGPGQAQIFPSRAGLSPAGGTARLPAPDRRGRQFSERVVPARCRSLLVLDRRVRS